MSPLSSSCSAAQIANVKLIFTGRGGGPEITINKKILDVLFGQVRKDKIRLLAICHAVEGSKL